MRERERRALAFVGLDPTPCRRGWWPRGARSPGRARCRRCRGSGPGRPGRSARRCGRGRGPGCRCRGRATSMLDAGTVDGARSTSTSTRAGSVYFTRVLEQVGERRHELAAVADDRHAGAAPRRPRCRCRAARRAAAPARPPRPRSEPTDTGSGRARPSCLDPRQLEQVVDDARHPRAPRATSARPGGSSPPGRPRPPASRPAAPSAPTGVFSSWLMLATKSRRIASSRRRSVTSSIDRRHAAAGSSSGEARHAPGPPGRPVQVEGLGARLARRAPRRGRADRLLDERLGVAHRRGRLGRRRCGSSTRRRRRRRPRRAAARRRDLQPVHATRCVAGTASRLASPLDGLGGVEPAGARPRRLESRRRASATPSARPTSAGRRPPAAAARGSDERCDRRRQHRPRRRSPPVSKRSMDLGDQVVGVAGDHVAQPRADDRRRGRRCARRSARPTASCTATEAVRAAACALEDRAMKLGRQPVEQVVHRRRGPAASSVAVEVGVGVDRRASRKRSTAWSAIA